MEGVFLATFVYHKYTQKTLVLLFIKMHFWDAIWVYKHHLVGNASIPPGFIFSARETSCLDIVAKKKIVCNAQNSLFCGVCEVIGRQPDPHFCFWRERGPAPWEHRAQDLRWKVFLAQFSKKFILKHITLFQLILG